MTPPESPDAEEIRAHYGQPDPRVVAKQLTRLDRHARAFIALSPFLVIASAVAAGVKLLLQGTLGGLSYGGVLANAASVAAYEAWRQLGYAGS